MRSDPTVTRTLLPQDEADGVKDECEIEEGAQDTQNRKCFKAGQLQH